MNSKEIIQIIADACDSKQAKDIVVLDMDQLSLVADYFLICHGTNDKQVQAIAKAVTESLEEQGIPVNQMEGFREGRWIIIDAGGILCHIFNQEERGYYNLERLWGDASQVPLEIGQEG